VDGLKQVEVVAHTPTAWTLLGLRGDGALFYGRVTIDHDGKPTVDWAPVIDKSKK